MSNEKESQAAKRNDGAVKSDYYWVRFQAKSSKEETDDVQLSVNGETLIFRREDEVVVPQRFLECADHATHDQFRQLPGKPRKVVAKIKTYPYERLRPATEAEFKEILKSGTRKTRDLIAKHGQDLDPESIED